MAAHDVRGLAAPPDLNPTGRFELALLGAGLRDLVRLGVDHEDEARTTEALGGLGFVVVPWRYALAPVPTPGIDGYHVGARLAAPGVGTRSILFVSREADPVPDLDALARDDWFLGLALGYPRCCIDAFCADADRRATGYQGWFEGARGPLPYWTNAPAEVFGWLLVSHLPCDPRCRPTALAARRHLRFLLDEEPAWAARTVAAMRSHVLVDPDLGIASVPEAGWGPSLDTSAWSATAGWRHFVGDAGAVPVELGADGGATATVAGRRVRHLDFTGTGGS